jgi:hypothetical protein
MMMGRTDDKNATIAKNTKIVRCCEGGCDRLDPPDGDLVTVVIDVSGVVGATTTGIYLPFTL